MGGCVDVWVRVYGCVGVVWANSISKDDSFAACI